MWQHSRRAEEKNNNIEHAKQQTNKHTHTHRTKHKHIETLDTSRIVFFMSVVCFVLFPCILVLILLNPPPIKVLAVHHNFRANYRIGVHRFIPLSQNPSHAVCSGTSCPPVGSEIPCLVDVGRGAKHICLKLSGDFPLNHNEQKCKMCPNNNHEWVILTSQRAATSSCSFAQAGHSLGSRKKKPSLSLPMRQLPTCAVC